MTYSLTLATEADTEHLGRTLAETIDTGIVIYLVGELGAGKTRLAQAVIHGLGYAGHVKSPTYTMVETYPNNTGVIYHFDLYRLMDPMELEYMGIQDYFDSDNIILIEWPDKGGNMIQSADIVVNLSYADIGRLANLSANSHLGEKILSKLKQNL